MVQVEVRHEHDVDRVERPRGDRPDQASERTDPRLGGGVGEEADPIEIDPDARMAQELDRGRRGDAPGCAVGRAVVLLVPGAPRRVGVEPDSPVRLAAAGPRDEVRPLGHLVLKPPDVRVLG